MAHTMSWPMTPTPCPALAHRLANMLYFPMSEGLSTVVILVKSPPQTRKPPYILFRWPLSTSQLCRTCVRASHEQIQAADLRPSRAAKSETGLLERADDRLPT